MPADLPKLPKRPKRPHVVGFRLTDEEAARLDAAAEMLKRRRTRGDIARALVCKWAKIEIPEPVTPKRYAPRRMPKADIKAIAAMTAALGKVGGNVNQLAKTANRFGQLPELNALLEIAAEISAMKAMLEQAFCGDGNDHQRQ